MPKGNPRYLKELFDGILGEIMSRCEGDTFDDHDTEECMDLYKQLRLVEIWTNRYYGVEEMTSAKIAGIVKDTDEHVDDTREDLARQDRACAVQGMPDGDKLFADRESGVITNEEFWDKVSIHCGWKPK